MVVHFRPMIEVIGTLCGYGNSKTWNVEFKDFDKVTCKSCLREMVALRQICSEQSLEFNFANCYKFYQVQLQKENTLNDKKVFAQCLNNLKLKENISHLKQILKQLKI